MASLKRLGFFWGEEKITVVEFEKNVPHRVISSPLAIKASTPSPFSSNLTEEIQITAVLQRMLQDNQITGGSFYVSLPMKEIVLRSFIIPFVKPDEIQNVIKFEAKKYIPFDIQDLSFVFYSIPFYEDQTKRLQIIFFAARKEVLAKYERILKQVNGQVSLCEPYMVSLSKALLFKKEIKPTDHLAFLILEQNLGRICFIDKGIPQFIREFPISSSSITEGSDDTAESVNLKIINEVGNSFDFYTRQFSGDRIEQMLVSSEFVQKDLLSSLETELKVKLTKFSPIITMGAGPSNDMETVYAMGACVAPPMEALSEFNFLGTKKDPQSKILSDLLAAFKSYQEVLIVLLICLAVLGGVYVYFQSQLKVIQNQYNQLASTQGEYKDVSTDDLQGEAQQNTDKLTSLKNIRTRSEVVSVMLRVASHLPQGALLNSLDIKFEGDFNNARVTVEMKGDVLKDDPNEGITVVNQIFLDLKNDKELAKYVKNVNLDSLNSERVNNRQATGFYIRCF